MVTALELVDLVLESLALLVLVDLLLDTQLGRLLEGIERSSVRLELLVAIEHRAQHSIALQFSTTSNAACTHSLHDDVLEMDNVSADSIQKVLVVRDDEQRLLPAREVVLEPHQGVEVQVVGRLIE